MAEIDLLRLFPKSNKPIGLRKDVTEEDKQIAKKFGFEYFDGDRKFGYGGYNYDPKYWTETVKLIKEYYSLPEDAKILDVGCAKGFVMHDFQSLMPKAVIKGIEISEYAIQKSIESVRDNIIRASADSLPFEDGEFDLVLAINSIHNLPYQQCIKAILEAQRVSKKNVFIVLDAWRNQQEKNLHDKWVVTCETAMSVEEWKATFHKVGYRGDYYWTFSL
jgi:ubiquinone/menaquinone biosynthesis C-methylase UbiE